MADIPDDDALLGAIIARSNRLSGVGVAKPTATAKKRAKTPPSARPKQAIARAPLLPFAAPQKRASKSAGGLVSVEVCAGAGGQALGLEEAGFDHQALVELDPNCCATLRANRPQWNVVQADLREFSGKAFRGADLLAGGLPCPPFSVAGKQLGDQDERNLFPAALRLVDEIRPRAVMIENVRGFLDPVFQSYREKIRAGFKSLGYAVDWRLLNAADFGVSQLRPRVVIVALPAGVYSEFRWPSVLNAQPASVGDLLHDLMGVRGWRGVTAWRKLARGIAPTIVGGSLKHGGPDLGPTRARRAWAQLGVDGLGIANDAPERDFQGMPRLTTRMVARIQGFPDQWAFTGKKTAAYRQVGNAFPPPVAAAVAHRIAEALSARRSSKVA
jgi:DNA (cytosine-5)-methyltransferase 1